MLTEILGQPFRYEALDYRIFLENMRQSGAEMAYMNCVGDNLRRIAERDIPGVEETFDNFPTIAGKEPVRWPEFIRKHRAASPINSFLSGPFGENQAGFSFTSALRHLGSPSEKFFKYKFINQIKTHPARNDIVEIL
jgi:hypothetical protein